MVCGFVNSSPLEDDVLAAPACFSQSSVERDTRCSEADRIVAGRGA